MKISATSSRGVPASALTFLLSATALTSTTMFRSVAAFGGRTVSSRAFTSRAIRPSATMLAAEGQAEVILVGCGAPNRGMGWYHAIQMLEEK